MGDVIPDAQWERMLASRARHAAEMDAQAAEARDALAFTCKAAREDRMSLRQIARPIGVSYQTVRRLSEAAR